MVTGYARQKVNGGKLISVRLAFDLEISEIEILGDFFIHPEEGLADIENSLIGMQINKNVEQVAETISRVATENNIEMIGVTPEAIANTINMAVKNGMASNKSYEQ